MENKIFILTQDLSFFYRLNKELNRLNIKFKVLNIGNKIPNIPCLIITTIKEIKKIQNPNPQSIVILSYDKNNNFEQFILKLLAAYRIGYKVYREMTFSIDPGTKHIGLVIFLDDYYLNSHTIYEKKDLIKKVNDYVNFFQLTNPNLINLNFKLGKGVLPMTKKLVNLVFKRFKNRKNLRIYLIDEAKSSQIKIFDKGKKMPKHEASALILAIRDGTEINQNNYRQIFNQINNKKFKEESFENSNDLNVKLGKIAEEILSGIISLNKSIEIINDIKLHKC